MRKWSTACVMAGLLGVAGCNIWPSARVDLRGLGEQTPLAQALAPRWMDERALKQVLELEAIRFTGGTALTTDAAQRFGFTCAQDVASCFYKGTVIVRYTHVPAENASRSAERLDFDIRVAQAQPVTLTVQVTRTSFNGGL